MGLLKRDIMIVLGFFLNFLLKFKLEKAFSNMVIFRHYSDSKKYPVQNCILKNFFTQMIIINNDKKSAYFLLKFKTSLLSIQKSFLVINFYIRLILICKSIKQSDQSFSGGSYIFYSRTFVLNISLPKIKKFPVRTIHFIPFYCYTEFGDLILHFTNTVWLLGAYV